MTVQILIGDCRERLKELESGSVHCCVCSPPYFGLRDYGTADWEGGDPDCQHSVGGQVQDTKAPGAIQTGVRPGVDASKCRQCGATRLDRQMGLEPTPDEYVAGMVGVFREVRRVLRDDGTLWLNIGDSYAGYHGNKNSAIPSSAVNGWTNGTNENARTSTANRNGLKSKDLIGIPWMLAFALRADGWYLRQDIIWSKPNPMPESVRDRCTKAHEYLFLLSKSPTYFYDQDAIAEASSLATIARLSQDIEAQAGSDRVPGKTNGPMKAVGRKLGAKGSEAPSEVRLSAGVRMGRGAGWRKDPSNIPETRNRRSVWEVATQPFSEAHFATYPPGLVEPCILAGCPKGGTVLDPFGGAGTTGLVADRLGRNAVMVELNPEYAEIAHRRLSNDGGMFADVKVQSA